jgi:hypothetical protein
MMLIGGETFEGEPCYRIKGFDSSGDLEEVWISKRDFLIRKVLTHSTFENFSTVEEEIHQYIKVNEPIPEATFDFKPPITLQVPTEKKEGEVLYAPEAPAWSEFSTAEGRFKVLMPGIPVSQTLTLEMHNARIVHHSYLSSKRGVTCVVDYVDLAPEVVDPNHAKILFDEARDQFIKDSQGKLATETPISLEGYPGREVRLHVYGGEAVARFYLVGDRFYQLAIIAANPAPNPNGEIDNFFSSFKIIIKPKPVT